MRILTGLTVTLLLSALSMGMACEVSCSFALNGSDCHSLLAMSSDSDHADRQMSSMELSMEGMSMPSMADSERSPDASRNIAPIATHPTIGEMGSCEQQSCDNHPVTSLRSARSDSPQFHAVLSGTNTSRVTPMLTLPHIRGEDIPPRLLRDSRPSALTLRI